MIRRNFLKLCLIGIQGLLWNPFLEFFSYAKEKLGGNMFPAIPKSSFVEFQVSADSAQQDAGSLDI